MKELKVNGKKFVIPLVGGGVGYLISGVLTLAVVIFAAIFVGQWVAAKRKKPVKTSSKRKK